MAHYLTEAIDGQLKKDASWKKWFQGHGKSLTGAAARKADEASEWAQGQLDALGRSVKQKTVDAADAYKQGRKGTKITPLKKDLTTRIRALANKAGRAGQDMPTKAKLGLATAAATPGAAIYASRHATGEDDPKYTEEQLAAPVGAKPRSDTMTELHKMLKGEHSDTVKAGAAGAMAGGLGGYALGRKAGMGATGALAGSALGGIIAALAERKMSKTAAAKDWAVPAAGVAGAAAGGIGMYKLLSKLREKKPGFFKRPAGVPHSASGASLTGDSEDEMEKGVLGQASLAFGALPAGVAAAVLTAKLMNQR